MREYLLEFHELFFKEAKKKCNHTRITARMYRTYEKIPVVGGSVLGVERVLMIYVFEYAF